MAINLSDIVDVLHPTPSGIGVFVSDQIWIVFDREIDENSISEGNFFVAGPDTDTWIGPDLQLYNEAKSQSDEDSILQSPGFDGIVQGAITFQRINLNNLTEVSTQDTVGSGHLYRTKAIFTPTNRLKENTEYTVYLSGDEDTTDSLDTGISSRTIFDDVASGINTSTGDVSFSGEYIGVDSADYYVITISTGGDVDSARFTFYRSSDPLTIYGPFRTRRAGVLLSDGVYVSFTEGTYVVGDSWTVLVKERTVYEGNLAWTFKTGSGSIQTIPTETSTSVLGDPVATSSTTTSGISVLSTNPVDGASNITIPSGVYDVTVKFSTSLDPNSVVSGVDVSVVGESVLGYPDVAEGGTLIAEPLVSSDTLTIRIAAGQLLQNNLITITLDSSIANTQGETLGSDYSFEFTTKYSPMYCSKKRLDVTIGAFITQVPEDTINQAIHIASLEADAITWNTANQNAAYYKFAKGQWACCRAAQILLPNANNQETRLRSKRLGDLEVSYDTTARDLARIMDNIEKCLMQWEGAVIGGGAQVQTPEMVVKGELDQDRPSIGRRWLHSHDPGQPRTPAANMRVRPANYRRYYNIRGRFVEKKGWWSS